MQIVCLLLQLEDIKLCIPLTGYQSQRYTTDSLAALESNKTHNI